MQTRGQAARIGNADEVDPDLIEEEVLRRLASIPTARLVEQLRDRGVPYEHPEEGTPSSRPNSPVAPQPSSSDEVLRACFQQFLATMAMSQSNPTPSGSSVAPTAAPAVAVTPPPRSSMRFPDPPTYEGDPTALETWAGATRLYLEANGVDLNTRKSVEVACMFLRGKAADWWFSRTLLVNSGQAVALTSWQTFIDNLTVAFRPHELAARYAQQLLHISQGKSEMRTYIANFNSARSRIPGELGDVALSHVFLQGCRPEYRTAIALQKPLTLDAYLEAAVLVADINFEYQTPAVTVSKKVEKEKAAKGSTSGSASVKPTCSHCGKPNHSADKCFQLHPELKTRGRK